MPIDTRPLLLGFGLDGDSSSCPPLDQIYGLLKDLEASFRTPPACSDACPDCHASTFTRETQRQPEYSYRYRLSDNEARENTDMLLNEIKNHKHHISQVLLRHGDDLMARWSSKGRFGSQQKREDLLKTVAPDLPESHIFQLSWGYRLCSERMKVMSRSVSCQHKLLLPWLTVELLKNHPDALFALLHYRTLHGPEEWAVFDCLQFEKHFLNGDFDADWSCKAMVMHGKHTYGTLVDWDIPGIHRADLIGFPLGRLILGAQAYLMRVLRQVVDAILVGIPLSVSARTDKWQCTILRGDFKPMGSVETWSPYTHGFLCAAPRADRLDVLTLTRSRRERAEDHLRALQCNISYMRRQIQVLFEAPVWKAISAAEKGACLTAQVQYAIRDYLFWKSLETEVEHFCAMRLKYGDIVAPGKPLPFDYDQALGVLDLLLINHIIVRSKGLLQEMSTAPGLSKHWASRKPPAGGPLRMFPVTQNNTMEFYETDRLYWILAQLTNHPDSRDAFDFPMLFSMLQQHLASSPRKERERLDELFYQHVNDLAACHELSVTLGRLHRPQSSNQGLSDAFKTNRLAWRLSAGANKPGESSEKLQLRLSRIGIGLMEAFQKQKPPQGPRGKPWVEYNRQLHSAVDRFWVSLKEMKKIELAHTKLTSDEEDDFYGVLAFGTTIEHSEAVHAEEIAILEEMERREKKLATPVPVFTGGPDISSHLGSASVPSKTKTRPEKEAHDASGIRPKNANGLKARLSELSLADDNAILDPIPVSRRNFDEVFGAMFPYDKAEAKRSVDWNTFSRAMKAVGCVLDNGSGGSEVLFKHEKFGKITFHKPHPEPKVDPIMLHAWGDRLARRFQWGRERFVVMAEMTDGGKD